MTRLRLPYLHPFYTRHGKLRIEFRRKGFKRVGLPGLPGSAEFMAAYHAALEQKPPEINAAKTIPGTVNAAVVLFYKSGRFLNNKPITQRSDRRMLEAFRIRFGKLSMTTLDRKSIQRIIDEKVGKPARQRHLLRLIRMLLAFAVEQGWRTDNPAIGIKPPRYKTQGYHSWTEEELQQYEAHHAVGTKARLAFALLLWTAQRRSDVVQLGPANLRSGHFHFTQSKTGKPMKLMVAQPLVDVLAATPIVGVGTYLVTDEGKPYTAHSFGNRFKDWCADAGLPQCSAHGLRKACLRRGAEAQLTEDMIASISGHENMDEIRTYVRAANKARMAAEGMAKIVAKFNNGGE
jgi:integrase